VRRCALLRLAGARASGRVARLPDTVEWCLGGSLRVRAIRAQPRAVAGPARPTLGGRRSRPHVSGRCAPRRTATPPRPRRGRSPSCTSLGPAGAPGSTTARCAAVGTTPPVPERRWPPGVASRFTPPFPGSPLRFRGHTGARERRRPHEARPERPGLRPAPGRRPLVCARSARRRAFS
jgi:hypothetical protein